MKSSRSSEVAGIGNLLISESAVDLSLLRFSRSLLQQCSRRHLVEPQVTFEAVIMYMAVHRALYCTAHFSTSPFLVTIGGGVLGNRRTSPLLNVIR